MDKEYFIDSNAIWKKDKQFTCKELCDELNNLSVENDDLNKEISRLSKIISDLHMDLQNESSTFKKYEKIIMYQKELLELYQEFTRVLLE